MQNQIEFFTPKEIASVLKVSTATIRNMIKRGDMQALQLKGGRGIYRVPSTELQRMLRACLTFQECETKSVFEYPEVVTRHDVYREKQLFTDYIKQIPKAPVQVTKDMKLRDVFFGSDNSHRCKSLNKRIHGLFFKSKMQDMTVSEFTQTYGAMDLKKFRQFGASSVEAVYNAIYTLND